MDFTRANMIMILGHLLALFLIGHARDPSKHNNGVSSYAEGQSHFDYNNREPRCKGKCAHPPYEKEHTQLNVEEEGIHKESPLNKGIKTPHHDISKVEREEYKAKTSFMMKPYPYKGFEESIMEEVRVKKGKLPTHYHDNEKGGHNSVPYSLSRSKPPRHVEIGNGGPPIHYDKLDHKEIGLSHDHEEEEEEESNMKKKGGYTGKLHAHYHDNSKPYKGETISRIKPPSHDDDVYSRTPTHYAKLHHIGSHIGHASHGDNNNIYKGKTLSRSGPPRHEDFGYDKPPPFHYDEIPNKIKPSSYDEDEGKHAYYDDENGG